MTAPNTPPADGLKAIYVQMSDDGQHIRKWSREPFAGATAYHATPAPDAAIREAQFLCDRLQEFESELDEREWHGHVAPSLARLEDALAQQPQAVPEGWRLLPVEPTDGMIAAGREEMDNRGPAYAEDIWSAMIAAAPVSGRAG